MKEFEKTNRVFAALGVLAIIISLIAVLTFTHSVGAAKGGVEDDAPASVSKSRYTYLVLGKDRVSGLTDVMMLVSIDTAGKRAGIVQIPRDTYAKYSDKGYRKFNGALATLGADGLCRFVEENMGVLLDGYFIFDLDTVVKAVDMLGGVEINIPDDMYYRDEAQGLDISLKKGIQRLDGKAAENFVRYRFGYLRGDLGRIDAQKLFISALIQQVKSTLTPAKAIKIASVLLKDVRTDVKMTQVASLIFSVFDIEENDILLVTLAGEDIKSDVSGAWYYVVSKGSAESILKDVLCADVEFDKDGVFRNEDDQSFERIYFSNPDYEAKTSQDIAQNGIEIEKR